MGDRQDRQMDDMEVKEGFRFASAAAQQREKEREEEEEGQCRMSRQTRQM